MDKILKEDGVVFNLKCENETSNMNSFEMIHGNSKILEMVDGDYIELGDLKNLFLNCFKQGKIFFMEFN